MIAYCAAVGAGPAGSLGRARARRDGTGMVVVGGSSIDELVNRMAGDFEKRRPFSLGMLAAPFLPVAAEGQDVSRLRTERRVQTTVLAVSEGHVGAQVNELARVLIRLTLLASDIRATLDVMASVETDATAILVWEAALAGASNTAALDLVEDAASATVKFLDDLDAGLISAVNAGRARPDFPCRNGSPLEWARGDPHCSEPADHRGEGFGSLARSHRSGLSEKRETLVDPKPSAA